MAEKTIVSFPTMKSLHDALDAFAQQNALTPAEVADIFIAGCVQVQGETGRTLEPIVIFKGYVEGAPPVAEPAKEGA